MKKLISLFLFLLACAFAFQACSDSKTYAEMLEDEKKAISAFIKEHNIAVISAEEFEKNGFETNVDKNEYVQLSNGVYMQIVSKGDPDSDSIRNRDVVSVRFVEYDIMEKDTTAASNYDIPDWLDSFDYTISGTTVYGRFRSAPGEMGWFTRTYWSNNQPPAVPEGWLSSLKFVKHKSHVKLIVPSKAGHAVAMQYVYPYFYDLRRITVW